VAALKSVLTFCARSSACSLSALDIPRVWMPKTFEGTEFTGVVNEETARLTGLKAGTPVAAGAWGSVADACKACVRITGSTQPEALHRELYPALKNSFHTLGRVA